MTGHSRVGTQTKTITWLVAAMLPVAALTASALPWKWDFAFLYVAIAFGLQTLVRLENPGIERLAHILVLSGSAPIFVRSYFGNDLTVNAAAAGKPPPLAGQSIAPNESTTAGNGAIGYSGIRPDLARFRDEVERISSQIDFVRGAVPFWTCLVCLGRLRANHASLGQ